MKNKKKDKIKCDVDTCTHNNSNDKCCELDSIKISCTCNNDECECLEETVCQSFEKTSGNINDNEYEVISDTEIIDMVENLV